MSQQHSIEPWGLKYLVSESPYIVDSSDDLIANTGFSSCRGDIALGEANARRIVACVNRCAGISNELLETSPDLATAFMSAENARLMQKNNELLFALKRARTTLEHENNKQPGAIRDTIWYSSCETLFDFMDSAIADAEAV